MSSSAEQPQRPAQPTWPAPHTQPAPQTQPPQAQPAHTWPVQPTQQAQPAQAQRAWPPQAQPAQAWPPQAQPAQAWPPQAQPAQAQQAWPPLYPDPAPAEPREPMPTTRGALLAEAPEPRMCFDPALAFDRAYGAILGAALGDALGLQVEGDEPEAIKERHPDGLDLPYKGAYKGHPTNDWSDATDFAVIVMRSLGAYFAGKTDNPGGDFASRVFAWQKNGYPELGDTAGMSPEGVVLRAVAQPGFLRDPFEAARAIKGPKADNGALIRAAPCAFTAVPVDWSTLYSEATHADDRCAASAVMLSLLLNRLSRVPAGAAIDPRIAIDPIAAGRAHIKDPARRADYMRRLTDSKRFVEMKLGERDGRSYTLKTLSCAMWAVRRLAVTPAAARGAEFFKTTLRALAAQGGDASANGAVVGAVLGAALGHQLLPPEWLKALPNLEWLVRETEGFLKAVAPTWVLPDDPPRQAPADPTPPQNGAALQRPV